MTYSLRKLIVAVFWMASLPALAQDEQPRHPEEVYRYAAFDTGDAIEVDWAIDEGYYLYRNKLGFESATSNVVFAEPQLPAGLPHEDEFFGKQQIYRDNFYVRIPYQVEGERPETMDLVIKSQGCWDGGLCYPPQVWTEKVELKGAAPAAKLNLGEVGSSSGLGGSEFVPVDEAFRPILIPIDGNTVEVSFEVLDGYYLYKDKISVSAVTEDVQLGRLDLPTGKIKVDEFFGESEVYFDDVFARLPLARATRDAMELELEINFQGCAEGGLCYPPTTRVVSTTLPEATAVSELAALPDRDRPVTEQAKLA
jgi:thiol:disulfide interchange protein DsbD